MHIFFYIKYKYKYKYIVTMSIYYLFYDKLPWHIIYIINNYCGNENLLKNSKFMLNKNNIIYYLNLKNVKIHFELYKKNNFSLFYNNNKLKIGSPSILLNKYLIKQINFFDCNYLKLDIARNSFQLINLKLLESNAKNHLKKLKELDKYLIFFNKLKKLDDNIYKNILNCSKLNKYLIEKKYVFNPIIKIREDVLSSDIDETQNIIFGIIYYIKIYFNNTNYFRCKNNNTISIREKFENFSLGNRLCTLIFEPQIEINKIEKKINIHLYCESIYY